MTYNLTDLNFDDNFYIGLPKLDRRAYRFLEIEVIMKNLWLCRQGIDRNTQPHLKGIINVHRCT